VVFFIKVHRLKFLSISHLFHLCYMSRLHVLFLEMTVLVSDGENKLLSFSLCNFLDSPPAFSLFGLNIVLGTGSQAPSICRAPLN
jgi:hypothetical protein